MRAALADLQISLGGIRDLVQNILAETGLALTDPHVLRRHEIQQCACPVLLSGYFESFLKDVIKAFVGSVASRGRPFATLPERMRRVNFEAGGRVLTSVAKDTRRPYALFPHTTAEDVIVRLDSPRQNPLSGYTLIWEAFTDTQANPGPEVVSDLLRDLDVQAVWPAIAAKAGESESTLLARLNDLIVVRNACAHTGTMSPSPPGASRVLDYVDAIEKAASGIVLVLEDELKKY